MMATITIPVGTDRTKLYLQLVRGADKALLMVPLCWFERRVTELYGAIVVVPHSFRLEAFYPDLVIVEAADTLLSTDERRIKSFLASSDADVVAESHRISSWPGGGMISNRRVTE